MSEIRGQLSDAQREVLLRPIMPGRVSKDGKGFSHLEAFEVKAHLCRVFGFEGWSTKINCLTPLFETDTSTNKDGSRWTVGYLCSMTLQIYNPDGELVREIADVSTDVAQNQKSLGDAHDLAVKSAVSGALKRCATALGDQYGLSLYAKGSLEPLVRKVVPYQTEGTHEESNVQS